MDNTEQTNNNQEVTKNEDQNQQPSIEKSVKSESQHSIKEINEQYEQNQQKTVEKEEENQYEEQKQSNQGKKSANNSQPQSTQQLKDNKNSNKIEVQENSKFHIREAVHAGTWYTNRPVELNVQLNVWIDMAKCDITNISQLKAIIAPHGGFSFSGPTSAWAYKYVNKYCQNKKLKVFILGPCHYVFIRKCGITMQKIYETPIGNIEIDVETIKKLKEQIEFVDTDKDAEEEENSIEMHLPFLAKTIGVDNFKLIPIMVGSLDYKSQEDYGKVLSKYVDMDDTLFVVSSDLCHWGSQFSYQSLSKDENLEIYEHIEKLDQKAMELIELNDVQEFATYLQDTENTICGKHAIQIILYAFLNSKFQSKIETKFIRYAQSSIVKEKSDSSVSYASAVCYIEQKNQ